MPLHRPWDLFLRSTGLQSVCINQSQHPFSFSFPHSVSTATIEVVCAIRITLKRILLTMLNSSKQTAAVCLLLCCLFQTSSRADDDLSEKPIEFYDPFVKQIEGWHVAVDPKLLGKENQEVADKAFQALANHLQRVKYIVPPDRLAKLQELPIWIELDNPKLGNMQYHPGRGWLLANGHDPRLVKHVHIPRAKNLYARHMWAKHPYVVLHELAHSYHDQVLSFDHPEIIAAYEDAKEKGIYDEVLLYTGRKVRHYGMSNPKEYFAEATESYFGVNDFYPFVRAELKEHDPELFRLMKAFWGPVE